MMLRVRVGVRVSVKVTVSVRVRLSVKVRVIVRVIPSVKWRTSIYDQKIIALWTLVQVISIKY